MKQNGELKRVSSVGDLPNPGWHRLVDEIATEAFARAIAENRRLGIGAGKADSKYPLAAEEPAVVREEPAESPPGLKGDD